MQRMILAAIIGGLIAGTVDIGAACAINGLGPVIVLHAIASGLLGKASFAGGTPTALLGLILQWGMSIVIALIFGAVVFLWPWLRQRWVLAGFAGGAAIYVVMTFVVVPLSNAPASRSHPLSWMAMNLAAMFVFGLIVSFTTAKLAPIGPATG